MQSFAARRAERIEAERASSQADDCEYLADQIDLWKSQLTDAYRLGLSEDAAGLIDDLTDLAAKLTKKVDDLRLWGL